jgi:hypothetical protein
MTKNHGITLVEVIVATGLLVVVVSLVTSALTNTFDGYQTTQVGTNLDQEGQFILARLSYSTSRSDQSIVIHTDSKTFVQEGAVLVNVVKTNSGTLELSPTAVYGEYMSAVHTLDAPTRLRSITTQADVPTGSEIRLQVAPSAKIGGECSEGVPTFVGKEGRIDTYLDVPFDLIPQTSSVNGFANPAECVRYRILFSRVNLEANPKLSSVKIQKR